MMLRLVDVLGAVAAGVVRASQPPAPSRRRRRRTRGSAGRCPRPRAGARGFRGRDVAVRVLEELGDAVLLASRRRPGSRGRCRSSGSPGPRLGGVRLARRGERAIAERPSTRPRPMARTRERGRSGSIEVLPEVGRASNSRLSHGRAAWLARCGRRATSYRPRKSPGRASRKRHAGLSYGFAEGKAVQAVGGARHAGFPAPEWGADLSLVPHVLK